MVSDGIYRRTIALRGEAGDIAVAHEPARARLRATINFPRIDALPTIIARLRRIFDLAADPQVINAALARDPRLQPLVCARPGLRVPGAWDGFEIGLQTILAQRLSREAARAVMGQLARAHGSSLCNGPVGLERIFPSPQALANASLAGRPAACSQAITAFATACAEDNSLFERGANLEASLAQLCGIPGIDPWAAHHIAMRALREPDAFPEPANGAAGQQDLWRPWRAYAALHLLHGGEMPQARPDEHLKEAPQHETAA
jgi:AraC family transcriptional regulator of adaptative response / DNA-3-methyladenine glycosylase II